VTTNVSTYETAAEKISELMYLIGQPARIKILVVIGAEPACVCHLEAALGMRQATISQHLMALRRAGLVTTQREGRNVFYRLAQPGILGVLRRAAEVSGLEPEALNGLAARPVPDCDCPQCNPGADPRDTCRKRTSPGVHSSIKKE
jgi:ArsR family transcriptional regulator